MKNLLLGAVIFTSSLQAISLEEIIDTALSKNPSLSVIEAKLQANKQDVEIANKFSNPQIVLSKNSLDSSQAMSKSTLTIQQKIPYFSKREKKKNIALAQDDIIQERLRGAKIDLVEHIKEEAYTIWELKKLKSIIDEYIKLTKRNIELYESYTSVSNNQHMGIMKAELSLSDLRVINVSLESKIYSAYSRLSYLAAFKVQNLEINLEIEDKPKLDKLQKSLSFNSNLALQEKEVLKQLAQVKLANINRYPDFNLIAGYNYRENFDNYFNVGIGITLPIYGSEDAKEEKSRAILLSKKSKKNDTQTAIESQLEVYYSQMSTSYKIYHIINDDALPQISHMFELSNSSISIGSDLFKYIDILFQKLNLEKKSIKAIANYKRAEAKISQLKGEMR